MSPAYDEAKLTADQLKAVRTKGKVLVAASAGSGKTTAMVTRIVAGIADGISVRRMLVAVYNNAAADELRERLHEALFAAACRSDGADREKFRRALDELPLARIGTLHGFCQAFLRENFERAGLSPNFEVLDENSHAAYMRRALSEVFAEYYNEEDALFKEISAIFSRSRTEDNLKSNVIKLYELIQNRPDRAEFIQNLQKCFQNFEESEFFDIISADVNASLHSAASELESLLPALKADGQTQYAKNAEILIGIAYKAAGSGLEELVEIARSMPELLQAKKTKDADADTVDRTKNAIKAIKEVMGAIARDFSDTAHLKTAHAQNLRYVEKLVEIVLRFDEKLSILKSDDARVSFSDLERKTALLLSDCEEFSSDFDAVFIDEYQDVNPVQEFIISRLIENDAFMVGDVKQSIYCFRMADPAIFLRRKEEYEKGSGTVLRFTKNFRSDESILNFVNGVFGNVMTKQTADVDYRKDAAFETSSVEIGSNVQIRLFTSATGKKDEARGIYKIDEKETSEEIADADERQGAFIAAEISALNGRAKKEGGVISYGDVAVLFRHRNAAASKITSALRRAGIPVDDGSFRREKSLPERELINFLTIIDNPRQDIPLAGFLLSYFGGFTEDELADAAKSRKADEDLYDVVLRCADTDDELGRKIKKTLDMLETYRLKASFKNVAELMQTIVSDFCYDAYLSVSGEAGASDIIAFITSVPEKEASDLSAFLAGLKHAERRAEGIQSGGDRVKISTFHGFKGLEASVVFVADVGDGFSPKSRTGEMITDGEKYIGLDFFDLNSLTKSKTLSKLALERKIRRREIKEEMRLLYVALTRAKQYLYVTSCISAAKLNDFGRIPKLGFFGSDLDFISEAIAAGLKVDAFMHSADDFPIYPPKNTALSLAFADENVVDIIAAAQNFEYPYAAAARTAMKYSVSALDGSDAEIGGKMFGEYAKSGTLYHKVMQYIDYSAEGIGGVKAELERMAAEGLLTRDEIQSVDPEQIARCLASDVMRLAAVSTCYREKPFIMYAPAKDVIDDSDSSDRVLVQGVVDLIIDGKQRIIVDFKNSRLENEKSLKAYKKQLYLYKMAVEDALKAKVDKTVLYSFKTGEVVEL